MAFSIQVLKAMTMLRKWGGYRAYRACRAGFEMDVDAFLAIRCVDDITVVTVAGVKNCLELDF